WPQKVRCKRCKTGFNPEGSDGDLPGPVMDIATQDTPTKAKPAVQRKTRRVMRCVAFGISGLLGLLVSLVVLGAVIERLDPEGTARRRAAAQQAARAAAQQPVRSAFYRKGYNDGVKRADRTSTMLMGSFDPTEGLMI